MVNLIIIILFFAAGIVFITSTYKKKIQNLVESDIFSFYGEGWGEEKTLAISS